MSGQSLLSRYHPGSYSEEQFMLEKRIFGHSIFVSVAWVVVLWLVKLFEIEFGYDFSILGILPRELFGLRGIIFSPLIHANLEHLVANSLPLFVLSFSLFFFYRKSAYAIFTLIYFFSGVFVWIGGREALHIGVSGVIYGLAAFLFLSGVISHNIRLLTISLIVTFLYGSMFWGIFPMKPEISWEAHLWGGLSGFVLAWLYRRSAPLVEVPIEESDDGSEEMEELESDKGILDMEENSDGDIL
jgi:membrane associated rhomboid family serine protease